MAIVEKEISLKVCDCCGNDGRYNCEVCGMDLCSRCSGTFSLKYPRLCEAESRKGCCGKIGPFRIRNEEDHRWLFSYIGGGRDDETIILCPVHHQEMNENIRAHLLAVKEQEHEKDVRR